MRPPVPVGKDVFGARWGNMTQTRCVPAIVRGCLKMTKTRQEAAPSSKRGKYEKVRIVQFFKGLTASING